MRPRFSYCMDSRHPRACSSLSSLGFPITITLSRRITQALDTATGRTEALGLWHYTLYMQDYGGPVGFRMALVHPERIEALIVQDAVAHNEGLGVLWNPRRAFWADRG